MISRLSESHSISVPRTHNQKENNMDTSNEENFINSLT